MPPQELLSPIPSASRPLHDILDGARGVVQPPIRSEIFGSQRFSQHGRSLGETHRASRATLLTANFFPRLKSNIRALREAHDYIGEQASTGYDISPAAEWLLDNFHLIEAQLREIREGLPRGYFRTLPMLLDEPLAGLPRVYGVAWAFVAHTDSAFDEDLLAQFLSAYQESRDLNLNELWALPTTLRVVLIENLRRLAERVATNKAARAAANLVFDRIEAYSIEALNDLLIQLKQRGVERIFLAQLAQRLQDRRSNGDNSHQALCHDWLYAVMPDMALARAQQSADQAADNLSVSNAVTSLRAIGDADWPDIIAHTSALMRLMLTSQTFEAEHVSTRDHTLHGIEQLARRSGRSEISVAKTLLELMHGAPSTSDVDAVAGHWLTGAGRGIFLRALGMHEGVALACRDALKRLVAPIYLGSMVVGTLCLVAWLLLDHRPVLHGAEAAGWLTLLAAVLMLMPASEAVVAVINRLICESARPQHLPRLALANGIPLEHRVLVVIPAMLTSAASVQELVRRLHLHYLANPERHSQFALLSDWVDADTAQLDGDAVLLADVVTQIHALNALYPEVTELTHGAPRFIVLHRPRHFSETEQRWMGWERKRGKLELLVAALATGATEAFLDLGQESRIAAGTPYIVTLDSDTQLPPGRLRELVSVAAHPHNRPRLDEKGHTVVAGYGILQPRIATPLPAPKEFTRYHWLFAGQCGIDPYSAASSEVYQDIFQEGTFTGKGLLNVQAVHASLSERLPDGRVLSHDLLEGSIARCAAVSDISVIEDAPFHADVAASRVHRWTRGDWQLLPFLLNLRSYRLGAINRWKMLDNLRRSLVAPASLSLLLLALSGFAGSPWIVLGVVLACFCAGPLMGAIAGFSSVRYDIAKRHFYQQAFIELARAACGGLWLLGQLLEQSLMMLDAILRTLYRMSISKRHLLQWTTAAVAQASAKTSLPALLRLHWKTPLAAFILLLALLALKTPHMALTLTLCIAWAASPILIWWVSRPRPACEAAELPVNERIYLEDIARDTWRFFERCVTVEDNHLPPDNLQTIPFDMVAHRTSPTNIGLYLLSVVCARQFGWIGTQDLLTRLESTLSTLLKLQRFRGHFMNWYDTQTCSPLLPMYVSTVDSGNLSGHLLAVAQACRELSCAPFDCVASQRAIDASKRRLSLLLVQRSSLTPALREQLRWCIADHRATLHSARRDDQARLTADTLRPMEAAERLQALAHDFEQLAWQADFGFLYHRKRRLLHIGYRIAEQQLDAGFYDLLASESRLTSLLAIAKGDVPMSHWASLGRPAYAIGADVGLRSWSGSMFEYLMPSLVLEEPHGSVLQDACRAALREQIAFARLQDVPWGISESAYAGRDHTLAYQYAPQGVPSLALRRTPQDELVIAPYATALAAQIEPHVAGLNLKVLESLRTRARYGFVEAIDYTPARQSAGEAFTLVGTFMAHHQGMTIVAMANVLLSGIAKRWGMSNAHIEAVASLLHERPAREVSVLGVRHKGPLSPVMQRRRAPRLLREVLPGANAVEPTHILSNGRYSVSLRANGSGWSRWGRTGITRWRDDALRDASGSYFYLRWSPEQRPVSITQHPAPDPAANYHSVYHADRVCMEATWPHIQTHMTVWVSPEDDIEFRQIELRNLSDRSLDIELISAFEVTLADQRADEDHPAFTNLFVRAQWLAAHQALLFSRKPRLPTEKGLQLVHFLADSDAPVLAMRMAIDRQRWLGRNHGVSQPLADFSPLPEASSDSDLSLETGLDPVCALALKLRIAPHQKIQLTFATASSDNGATLLAVIDKYRQHSHIQRSSLMSATLMGIRLRDLRISAENFAAIQTLTTALVLSLTHPPEFIERVDPGRAGVCDRRLLWRHGISGDRPLILVSAGVIQGMGLLRSLAQALRLWAWGGVACDLVVLNAEPASYLMPLHREITALRERHMAESGGSSGSASTNLHLIHADALSSDELSTLQRLARVQFNADGRPLPHHVHEWIEAHDNALTRRQSTSMSTLGSHASPMTSVPVPVGKFAANTGEYMFDAGKFVRPVRPWINVLANANFGAHISEAGGGYTWALNSRLNQITGWSNDPVADQPSEWFFLQDRKTRRAWSLAPSAGVDATAIYEVSHGQGYTIIKHRHGDIDVTATWCVDAETTVKQVQVHLVNRGQKVAQLRVIGLAEWVMGANRADRNTVHTQQVRVSERLGAELVDQALVDSAQGLSALLCTQNDPSAGFGGGTAFFSLLGNVGREHDWTCDRREFFDARGRLVLPDQLGQSSGDGLDPCAALSAELELNAGQTFEYVFLLGYGASPAQAMQVAAAAAVTPAAQRLSKVRKSWDKLLGATTVKTPDPLFDAMVNRWLLYQVVSCRLWAKAGFYQAGGATGFRDQLQDTMALAWAAPNMLREQIVLCASRQFLQGDVQHWWHSPTGAGVRTHFSDDLLWLPYVCVHYLRATGDVALLAQHVPFIDGAEIAVGAEDAYYVPGIAAEDASVYEHAARAIDRSLAVGAHGLPLMGSGDWNDGMNRVGIEGRGESVWLGWFLCQIVADFAPLARERGDEVRAQKWEVAAQGWTLALKGPGWDGEWFKRAFFDNGEALGSSANPEARIDLIAQAWAVLSNVAPPAMQRMALEAVEAHLVDPQAGLVRLLQPPLVNAVPSAGYIQAYPAGVRENGGQYSHAGVWALMAQAQARRANNPPATPDGADAVYRYFTYLSPAHRASHPTHGRFYGVEPYVMAGDVYTQAPYVGRGGWSWYTGAAAWMHRAAVESIFGLMQDASSLSFAPCLPSHWMRAELSLARDDRTMRFIFLKAAAGVALKETASSGAVLLGRGELIHWHELALQSCFVIPLGESSDAPMPS